MRIMSGDRGTWNGDFVQKLKISRKSKVISIFMDNFDMISNLYRFNITMISKMRIIQN